MTIPVLELKDIQPFIKNDQCTAAISFWIYSILFMGFSLVIGKNMNIIWNKTFHNEILYF